MSIDWEERARYAEKRLADNQRAYIESRRSICAQRDELRATVDRIIKVMSGWLPPTGTAFHPNPCGCAWCEFYEDLELALRGDE